VLKLGGHGGCLLQEKMHKKEGEMGEEEEGRVDHQDIN